MAARRSVRWSCLVASALAWSCTPGVSGSGGAGGTGASSTTDTTATTSSGGSCPRCVPEAPSGWSGPVLLATDGAVDVRVRRAQQPVRPGDLSRLRVRAEPFELLRRGLRGRRCGLRQLRAPRPRGVREQRLRVGVRGVGGRSVGAGADVHDLGHERADARPRAVGSGVRRVCADASGRREHDVQRPGDVLPRSHGRRKRLRVPTRGARLRRGVRAPGGRVHGGRGPANVRALWLPGKPTDRRRVRRAGRDVHVDGLFGDAISHGSYQRWVRLRRHRHDPVGEVRSFGSRSPPSARSSRSSTPSGSRAACLSRGRRISSRSWCAG